MTPEHSVESKPGNAPHDGPATSFEPDTFVRALVGNHRTPETYGIVLVAGWPAPETWQQRYKEIIRPRLAACFPQDFVRGESSTVYLYPPQALHVTIATFWSVHWDLDHTTSPAQIVVMEESIKSLVEQAWQRYKLEQQMSTGQESTNDTNTITLGFELELASAQIGSKAGILLWRETTGRLQRFRELLKEVCGEHLAACSEGADRDANSLMESALVRHKVPNIIHSTILRFVQEPKTSGEMIQDLFRRTILDGLEGPERLVSEPIQLGTIALVRERRPHMHVPPDEAHIMWNAK